MHASFCSRLLILSYLRIEEDEFDSDELRTNEDDSKEGSDRSLPEDLFDQLEDEPLDLLDREPKKEEPSNPGSDARSEAGSFKSLNSWKTQKRRKTSNSGWVYTGSEYASKKAGGDVKRKDKLEPYAYWPLDRC
ncbi:hypothetical protein SADUNF_Sadunf06G0113200 [Salix dunnii]|uniref:Uncharacterized protein n=1 Tax=Salix dunnii TaxID=1413687 RepID=A0A835N0M2_9ROSI|nr:hypothetical protein SADUNF_Sadunf06G0113200 [Salix dunnii]